MKLPLKLASFLSAIFFIFSLLMTNYEFLIYAITLIVLTLVIYLTDKKFNFSLVGLWGFNLWIVLHLVGGLAYFQGTKFYDLILIPLIGSPYHILKYDQFVHFFCYFVLTLLIYDVIKTIVKKQEKNTITLFIITLLAATGIGGINEIIEFLAVVIVEDTGVGGYTNTALDIVFNFLGSLCAIIFLKVRN